MTTGRKQAAPQRGPTGVGRCCRTAGIYRISLVIGITHLVTMHRGAKSSYLCPSVFIVVELLFRGGITFLRANPSPVAITLRQCIIL